VAKGVATLCGKIHCDAATNRLSSLLMKNEIPLENKLTEVSVEKFEITDFRLYLQNELIERCKKNKGYSLRSFARFLGLDPSTLSQILRRKRNLTRKSKLVLGHRLGLGPEEMTQFLGVSESLGEKIGQAQELTLDTFRVIADWYHYAIFELVTISNFQPDAKWIAKTLAISINEAHAAIERLLRLELIEIGRNGKWKQGSDLITTTGNSFTATAFRKLQKQVIERAMTALEEVPIENRDQSSMTMAINSKRLPQAKERIKKFRRELCTFLQKDQIRDSVYQLGVSFYPLTKLESEKD